MSFMSLFRSMRWRVLLSAERWLKILDVFWATMVGYLSNSFLPARSGELIRSIALGRRSSISSSFVIATTLTEKIMDAVVLVFIGATAMIFTPTLPLAIIRASKTFAFISIIGLTGVLVFPGLERLLKDLIIRLPLSKQVANTLMSLLEKFNIGMRSLRSPSRALFFMVFTGIIWFGDAIVSIIVAKSLVLSLSISQALLLNVALGLSSAIPSTPGYLGIYQFVAVTILPSFGFSNSQALGYILVFQAASYFMTTIWGLLGSWQLGLFKFPIFRRNSLPE